MNITKDALAKEYPGSEAERAFNSYAEGALFDKSVRLCSQWRGKTSVINQGDSWIPNFLVKSKGGKDEEDVDVLMLDFQLARCCSPVLDIAFFLYSCTDKQLRDSCFDDLLAFYHDELSSTIASLGSDPAVVYPLSTFQQEVYIFCYCCFFFEF